MWKDSIFLTFRNGTAGEYPLAEVNVKFDGEEYQVIAALVQDLAEVVLLGRDAPLHKHMVKRLSEEEQISLMHQLARDNKTELEIKDKDKAFAVSTRSQQRGELHQEGAEGHQNKEHQNEEHHGYQEEELGQTEKQGEEKHHEERYYQEGEHYEAQHHQGEEQYQEQHREEQYQEDQKEEQHEGGRQHQEDQKDHL